MPLVLTFNGLQPGQHTYYDNLDTGAVVQVEPGEVVPVRVVRDAQQYVLRGMATISGEEDGSDGKLDLVTEGIRAVILDVDPLEGAPSSWTLPDMLDRIAEIQAADEASLEAHQRPHVASTSPASGAIGVYVDAVITAVFDKEMDPATITPASVYLTAGDGSPADVSTLAVDLDETGTIATLTLGALLTGTPRLTVGGSYSLAVTTAVMSLTGYHPSAPWALDDPFTVIETTPTIVSISPADGATDVAIGVGTFPVVVTFSDSMRPDTFDFVIPGSIWLLPTGDAAVPVMASFPNVAWDLDNTRATIETTAPLENGKGYKVVVSAGGFTLQNIGGVPITEGVIQDIGFTTVAA